MAKLPDSDEPNRGGPVDSGSGVLLAIGSVRQRFIDSSVSLGERYEVQATRTGMDCRGYESGTALEFWLEADLVGRTVCWWLDAQWRDMRWEISAQVLVNRDEADWQETLREFPDRTANAAGALAAALDDATNELLATAATGEFL